VTPNDSKLGDGHRQPIQQVVPYSVFFPAALAFFHRALAAAAIFALAATLILRRAFLTGFVADFRLLTFAHRAFCAAAIFRLPAALIFRRLRGAAASSVLPNNRASFFCSDSILCLMLAARRN
jgi:hypothetical protein